MTVSRTRPETPAADAIAALRGTIAARIIEPHDPDYDPAKALLYGGLPDLRPAAIIRVANDEDVQRVVEAAVRHDVELAVRGGGHSIAGHSTTDGGLVIDLRDLTSMTVDPTTRTAWVETGLTAAEVVKGTSEHGLAVGFGDTGSVGIGGITLGGGLGFLSRKHGLTIDSLLAADVVTAEGRLRRVDAEHEPDLFWAIRGGGGNFGVATRFQYRLAELPGIVGGFLFLPANAEVVERWVSLSEDAPDELTTIGNVMNCPPMPFAPAEWVGKLVVFGIVCWAGDAASGEKALAPFRALSKLAGLDAPIADFANPMPYPGIYPPEDTEYHPTAVSRNLFMDGFDGSIAATIMDRLAASDAPMRAVQLRVHGGAIARVPNDATAFAHRDRRIMVNVASFYEGEDDRPTRESWVTDLARTLSRGDDRAYVNFLGDEGQARVRAAYPGSTWERLVAIKRRYDPQNVFHRTQNIPPG